MPRYDFNWQTSYVFNEPLKLPEGTKLHCTAHFDNSADNPANPDPTKPVRWGDQTWEEMMIGWFDIAVPKDWDIGDVLPPQDRNFRARRSPQAGRGRRQYAPENRPRSIANRSAATLDRSFASRVRLFRWQSRARTDLFAERFRQTIRSSD